MSRKNLMALAMANDFTPDEFRDEVISCYATIVTYDLKDKESAQHTCAVDSGIHGILIIESHFEEDERGVPN